VSVGSVDSAIFRLVSRIAVGSPFAPPLLRIWPPLFEPLRCLCSREVFAIATFYVMIFRSFQWFDASNELSFLLVIAPRWT
jgi:hypothetical protein